MIPELRSAHCRQVFACKSDASLGYTRGRSVLPSN